MAKVDDYENKAAGVGCELGLNASRQVIVPRGVGFAISATTGTMAAALAANSSVFTMRLDPGTSKRAFIERIRLEWTTIVAFTTPITAGRRLGLFRGVGGTPVGGTQLSVPVNKHGTSDTSELSIANGGDIRIATTAALTVSGITFEANAFRELSLTHVGAAGAYREAIWEFNPPDTHPIQLDPGQVLAVRNIPAMDAAGTWQLMVAVDWNEAPALDFTG